MSNWPQRASIIGTGLVGGSLGLALEKLGIDVTGFDSDAASLEQALAKGAVARSAQSASDAVHGAELVVIAVPMEHAANTLAEIAPSLSESSVVTDVGSTKVSIVEAAARLDGIRFIGGHPLAGSERGGIEAASAELFRGCTWVLTPNERTDHDGYTKIMQLLGRLEAKVLSLDPVRHDEAVAISSHLPQVLATALMRYAEAHIQQEGLPLVAGRGFADMTRLAGSPSDLWVAILKDNKDAVVEVVRGFNDSLSEVVDQLKDDQWDGLAKTLDEGRAARLSLLTKPGLSESAITHVRVHVPDKPGSLAKVTTVIGEVGVNIEDLSIDHAPSGGGGTIDLAIQGEDAATLAIAALGREDFYAELLERQANQ